MDKLEANASLISRKIIKSLNALMVLCALGFTACAPIEEEELLTQSCVLASDQTNTLLGRWRTLPIYLSFYSGQFSAAEMAAVIKAADAWNSFYYQSSGISKVFDYGSRTNPRTTTRTKPSPICGYTLVNGSGAMTGSVAIYKYSSGWPYPSNAIAVTTYCREAASPLRNYTMAIMELNQADFYATGKPVPDTQTVFTHEFGHLLGLDHSCEPNKAGFPNCGAGQDDYIEAVMNYDVGVSEINRSLKLNDQARGNCLYGNDSL